MKISINKSDKYLLLIYYCFALPVGFMFEDVLNAGFAEATLNVFIYFCLSITLFSIIVFYVFPRFLPEQRIVTILFIVVLLFVIFGFFEIYLHQFLDAKLGRKDSLAHTSFTYLTVYALFVSFQNVGLLLAIFLGKKYFDTQLDLKSAEIERRKNELHILKAQIDPHFLFNNLNSVDALIQSNPSLARDYVQRLSNLYRYLLKTKDDDVVLFEEELNFAQDYIFLLENRFGKSYQFKIERKGEIDNKLIPPGALQTILENVIKHNMASFEEPVITTIVIREEVVIISNNIQANTIPEDSSGTGLKNLSARYRLLGDQGIQIESNGFFRVTIPLLQQIDA